MKSSEEKPPSAGAREAEGDTDGGGGGAVDDVAVPAAIVGIAIVDATGHRTAGRESSASTWRSSCCESNGFETIASQPSRSARSRSNGSKVPDRRITGIRDVAGFALIASQTS